MSEIGSGRNGDRHSPEGRRLEELAAENAGLREEVARLTAERDMYQKSLQYLTREDFTFTAEEIAELDKNGVEFTAEFIAELERDLRDAEPRDA